MSRQLAIFIVVLTLFFIGLILLAKRDEKKLYENYKITEGVIQDVEVFQGIYFLTYSFIVDDLAMKKKQRIDVSDTNIGFMKLLLMNRMFTVVYEASNKKNSRILLRKKDYEQFGLDIDVNNSRIMDKLDSLCDAVH